MTNARSRAQSPHVGSSLHELFWAGSMADGGYPSEFAFKSNFDEHCCDAFADYVGAAYADTRLDIYWLVSNENAWTMGDRCLQRAVFDPSNPWVTNSAKAPVRTCSPWICKAPRCDPDVIVTSSGPRFAVGRIARPRPVLVGCH